MNDSEKKAESFIKSMSGKRVKDNKTTTYIMVSVLKVKNNPHSTRWSLVKERVMKALRKEFGEDLV